ncbi:hypothetical protein [Geminisphaera colitermitum]|nr:hypothetical protein [Geminisphaera colitermitum]
MKMKKFVPYIIAIVVSAIGVIAGLALVNRSKTVAKVVNGTPAA